MKRPLICLIIVILLISFLLGGCNKEQSRITILLGADLTGITSDDRPIVMRQTIEIISKRLDLYGIDKPIVQQQGENRIVVKLPSDTDVEMVKDLLTKRGFLEFRVAELDIAGEVVYLDNYLKQSEYKFIDASEKGSRIFVSQVDGEQDNPKYETVAFLTSENGTPNLIDASGNPADKTILEEYSGCISWIPARGNDGKQLTGDYLSDVQTTMDTYRAVPEPAINIKWNNKGSEMFDEIASRLYNLGEWGSPQRDLGIFIDNKLLSAPEILQSKYEGSGVISGNFIEAEAQELANMLNSNALPVPIDIVELSTVSQ